MSDLDARVSLLERLAAQQLDLNDQLLAVTSRLGEEHALYQERQTLLTSLVAQHDERAQEHHEQLQQMRARLLQHDDQMAESRATHRALVEGFASLETRFDRLEAALLAIKDLLERGNNGH